MFVLALVPDRGRYLIVEERDGSFYLPAGRVEEGENLIAAAVRETAEEAGVLIGLRGLLGLDHSAGPSGTRLRFCFVGYPAIAARPKARGDHHSRGAAWRTREEIAALPLRHPEVLAWIDRLERGDPLLPCSAYGWEGPTGPRFSATLEAE
jgi:phosphatase NudJ